MFDLFEPITRNVRKHPNIIVIGQHRAGTTITAKILAHETGHGLVTEELCRFSPRGVDAWIATPSPVVIQAPFMGPRIQAYPHCTVVFVYRDPREVEDSKARNSDVIWMNFEMGIRGAYHTDDYDHTLMEISYRNWLEQRERLAHHLTIHYDDLESHPLFVKNRRGWKLRQTSAVG